MKSFEIDNHNNLENENLNIINNFSNNDLIENDNNNHSNTILCLNEENNQDEKIEDIKNTSQ